MAPLEFVVSCYPALPAWNPLLGPSGAHALHYVAWTCHSQKCQHTLISPQTTSIPAPFICVARALGHDISRRRVEPPCALGLGLITHRVCGMRFLRIRNIAAPIQRSRQRSIYIWGFGRTCLRCSVRPIFASSMRLPTHLVVLSALSAATIASPVVKRAGPQGIDVSNYQGTINWTTVASEGVAFAYIKATEGTSTA